MQQLFSKGWAATLFSVPPLAGGLAIFEGVPWQYALPWAVALQLLGLMATAGTALWRSVTNGDWVSRREAQTYIDSNKQKDEIIERQRQSIEALYRLASQGTALAMEKAKEVEKQ